MTSAVLKMEVGQRFIPYQTFSGDYLSVLENMRRHEVITYSEKEMLRILNKFSFKNGECYPSQKRLESEIGLKNGQVRNLLRSLEKKGLIEIRRPSPLQRHLFRKHNQYHFLWHAAYFFEYTEKTAEKQTDTETGRQNDGKTDTGFIYKSANQKVCKSKEPLRVFSARTGDSSVSLSTGQNDILSPASPFLKEIQSLSADVDLSAKAQGRRFSAGRFVGSAFKRNIHPQAIIDALVNLKKNLPAVESPWGYVERILKIRSGNYHERDNIRAAQALKEETRTNSAMQDFLNACLKSI